MDKELAEAFHRLERFHHHTMLTHQSQHHMMQVLIAGLLESGTLRHEDLLSPLDALLHDLDERGVEIAERSFPDFWWELLSDPEPVAPGRPGWFRGVIDGGKDE
ncbi:MAG: hypothetical protein RPU39_00340 [Candidatus Sedimenticola sp. (ex Thyasira tokunagai)]